MSAHMPANEDLLHSLPLPLAQLYRRALNAKTPLDLHQAAYFLWEAALKLLGSVAVVAYAERADPDPELADRLKNLARPALGHWWEFVRRLLPVLADGGDPGFAAARDLVLGRRRDDLPRAADLDALLEELTTGRQAPRAVVRLSELFDRLVNYRNRVPGHGAVGMHPPSHYQRYGAALRAGAAEVLARLDALAGRRLVYVPDVRRQASGRWLVERYELRGEVARRLESLDLPESVDAAGLLPDRLYLEAAGPGDAPGLRPLHPLLVYDAEEGRALFLNARRGRQRTEYLCYTTGAVSERDDAGAERRALLARVLGVPVDAALEEQWAARSRAEEPAVDREPESAAHRLGEFELLSELGRGGMGVVYRAWQPSLGRQVALKCLAKPGDSRAEARFRREIKALGQVDHPHLVKIFTSGADGDQWYYVMELVEGVPFSAVCDRLATVVGSVTEVGEPTWQAALGRACADAREGEKPLGEGPPAWAPEGPAAPTPAVAAWGRGGYVDLVVTLVRQVAGAVHALHEHGIIHRDIKLGNILVSADGTRATLMDLGLALLADDVKLTQTRQFVGTLRYASPQQVLAVSTLDRRTDVYSLGATLWELLALRPLFEATEQTPTPELMERIQREEPERLRRVHPGLGRNLEAVVHKCLEKAAERRYATALEFADELRRVQEGEPVRARPVGRVDRTVKWMRRHPTQTAAGALAAMLVVVLLVAAVGGWLLAVSAEQQARDARVARDRAEKEEAKALFQLRVAEVDRYALQLLQAQQELDGGRLAEARAILDECDDRLRHWEHSYLASQCDRCLLALRPHRSPVRGVAASANGGVLASASDDGTVKLCDGRSGREVRTLTGHTGPVLCVALSADGRRVVSGGEDQTVRIWDADTGKEERTLRGHAGLVLSVALSADGRRVVSGGEDRTVRVWDATTGELACELASHAGWIGGVAVSANGERVVSASADRTVKVWDTRAGRALHTLEGHTDAVLSAAFSGDGRRIASGGLDRSVKVWDAEAGVLIYTLAGHTDAVRSVAFSGKDRQVASAGDDRTIKVWSLQTGQETLALPGHGDWVRGVRFCHDDRWLISGGSDGAVKVWDTGSDQPFRTFRGHQKGVAAVAVSADGGSIVSGSDDRSVTVWDAGTGKEVLTLSGHAGWVGGVAVSANGGRVVSGGGDQIVRVWDAATGEEALALKGHSGSVPSVALGADRRIASGSLDTAVKIWDARTGEIVHTLTGHTGPVRCVAFSADGGVLASASVDQTINLWDVRSGRKIRTLAGHASPVLSVALSADGGRVVSGDSDGTLKFWVAATGEVHDVRGHTRRVTGLAMSGDGLRVISGSYDEKIKVWDTRTRQQVLTLKVPGGAVLSVALSRDGRRLVSGSRDGAVRVFEANAGQGEEDGGLPREGHGRRARLTN